MGIELLTAVSLPVWLVAEAVLGGRLTWSHVFERRETNSQNAGYGPSAAGIQAKRGRT